jgi:hypothetical protein
MWTSAFASIKTLNNNNPSPGQYTTWSAVHAACNAGDTIYVMGNNLVSYGYATVTTNNLTIVGNGYFPSGPNNDVAFFNGITIQAPFTTIDGLKATSITYDYNVAAGILVMRHCLIGYVVVEPTNFDPEFRFRYNVIGGTLSYAMHVKFAAGSNTYLAGDFFNNIFIGNLIFDNYGFAGCFMWNNIFKQNGNFYLLQGSYDVGIFASNIIINYGDFADVSISSNCVNNCIYATNHPTFTSLPNDNNSTLVGDPSFVNICTSCPNPFGGDYHLQPGSPCIGTGFFGTDMGVYGGVPGAYYAQRGEPFIPHIKQFTIPASGFYGAPFTANVVSWVKIDSTTNPNIIKGEYFWNTDPGVGNGHSFSLSSPSDSVTFSTTIQTSGANLFDNLLYIRTLDNAGHWSLSEVQPYYINNSIHTAEYFWDQDPGLGNGTPLTSFSPSDSINFNQSVSTAGIKKGAHIFYTRTKYSDGVWSLTEGRTIYVQPQIVSAEYFWDTDPGVGNGTALSSFTATDSLNINSNISTSGIKKGSHVFYTRTKDSDGAWSIAEGRTIYVQPQIVSAEYFWDTDPGVGNGSALSITASDSINSNQNISTTDISNGAHTLYTRTKDSDGAWSIAEGRNIYVKPWIKQGEHFWDTDPGFGNGTTFYSDNGILKKDSVNDSISISTVGMSRNWHYLYTRYKNNSDQWSLTEVRKIKVTNVIKAAEYFFDTDPGIGQATAIPVNPFDTTFNFSGTITLPPLAGGTHKIYFRTQDWDNRWSLPEEKSFYVYVNTLQATTIDKAEYFFDADPGVGNGINLPNVIAGTTVNYFDSIVLPQLPGGLHTLFLRTCDNNNHWSLVEPKGISFYSNTVQSTEITGAECFFDVDPGVGNGISLPNVLAGATVNYMDSIVLPQLSGGFHNMFVRTKDINEHWSLAEPKGIYIYSNSVIASSITEAGYFIDNDAGIANDYPISITAGATVNFNSVIILPSISNGMHTFNLRTKDNNGKWSIHEPRVFFAGAANAFQITNAEYFLDADPGVGNASSIAITTPAATVNQCAFLNLPTFTTGAHKLFLRTKDNRGIWALQEPMTFTGVATSSVSIAPTSPVNLCAGSSVNITATTTGGPWTVQWYNGCSLIAGSTSLTLTVTTAGTYSVVVTNGSISQSATVIVNNIELPNAFVVTGGGNYCTNQVGGLAIQLSGSQTGVNYQLLLNDSTNISLPIEGDGNSLTFSNQTLSGNYTVIATTIIGGCTSMMSNLATITVEQAITWYLDADADGFGDVLSSQEACAQPLGYVSDSSDCDDSPVTGASIHPFALEVCGNSIDDNCNGQIDEGCFASLNIKVFIEGYYAGNNMMQPVLFNSGVSSNDTLCDTVIVELHDPFNPSTVISSDTIVVDIYGNGNVNYPGSFIGDSYYIVIRARNALETWSKLPVTLGGITILDFTTP